MKGRGIRNRLIVSFFFIIALLFALDVFLSFMSVSLIKKYQDITDNMVTEYQIVTTTDNLVNSFNETVKLIHDPQQITGYNTIVGELNAIFAKLDVTITSEQSKSAYIGLKNTVQSLTSELSSGIGQAEVGNISETNIDYEDALQKEDFVRQNGATLIFDELDYTEQIQAGIAHDELVSEIIGGLLILLLSIGAIIYAALFSRRLTSPLINLTKLAKNIAGGDLSSTVDSDLLAATDEVGSLANSFNIMVQSLRKSIHELDSEKKAVEEKVRMRTRELVEERAQLLASINSLPLGFLLLDTADTILLSNSMVRELFPQKDQTLASLSQLFTPALDISELNRLIAGKQSYELQGVKLGEKTFRVVVEPVILSQPEEEGSVIGSVVLMEDITQEKALEQSKDAFLAIAAHEMRTPLTIIRGNSELMLDDPYVSANTGIKTQIGDVLESSVRLLDIVNDFLDVQNLEGGRISLNIKPVDIVALLDDTIHDLSTLAERKGLKITLNVSPEFDARIINLDKYRLQQIYFNVISNAIHYTEKGGATISLQREGGFVKVIFEDTGSGISPEEQKMLFNKFETSKVFLKSKEYGSGLGLYISRFIAHLMGGNLVLEKSEVGKGSVFCLTLPLGGVTKEINISKSA